MRDTMNLSPFVDSSTNTKTEKKQTEKGDILNVLCVRCHMSHVMCCMSPVICHLSLTATVTATDPPSTNSPIMHNRLVCKDLKT